MPRTLRKSRLTMNDLVEHSRTERAGGEHSKSAGADQTALRRAPGCARLAVELRRRLLMRRVAFPAVSAAVGLAALAGLLTPRAQAQTKTLPYDHVHVNVPDP